MQHSQPIPHAVFEAAWRVYIRHGKTATEPGDRTCLYVWSRRRYGNSALCDFSSLAFWALSLAYNYGVRDVDDD